MAIQASATIRPTCQARTGWAADRENPNTPLWCGQSVGISSLIDAQGVRRHFCMNDGHRAAVVRYYGLCVGCENGRCPDHSQPYLVADPVESAKKAEFDRVTFDGGRHGDIEIEVV